MKKYLKTLIFIIIVGIFFSCNPKNDTDKNAENTNKQSIMVFAAASLTDVLSEITDSFVVKYSINVKINIASSGTLARQIEQGGSPDVYISASKKWADYVDNLGYILKDYKTEIAQNNLVLIAPLNSKLKVAKIDSSLNFIDLLATGRLSIGDPLHVPAGKYAKQALNYFGWYNQLKNKILPAKDVRSALMTVEMEEAPIGIVYQTDALKSEKVKILGLFPKQSHKSIVYLAGVCNDKKAAKDFFKYLSSIETKTIWEKYGF